MFNQDGKIDPTSLLMWDKHCYIRDNLHATYNVINLPSCWMTSEFYICNVEKWDSTSIFQTLTAFLFMIENITCGYGFS